MPDPKSYRSWNPEEDISSAEAKFDFDLSDSFDRGYISRLPENAVGATRQYTDWRKGMPDRGNDLILDGYDLPRLPEEMRQHVLAHEWVHAEHNRGELYGELLGRGMDPETADNLWKMMSYGPEWMKEGATELAALYLDPDSDEVAGSSYPVETAKVSELLERNDSHPDSDLASEINDYMSELRQYHSSGARRYT